MTDTMKEQFEKQFKISINHHLFVKIFTAIIAENSLINLFIYYACYLLSTNLSPPQVLAHPQPLGCSQRNAQ